VTIPGNPKGFARDVTDGFFVFNQATLRRFLPEELKSLYRLLEQVAREIRAEQIPPDQITEIQRKNLRLGRANTALMIIRNHAKRHRLVL
jgi:hypothetical protein